MYTAPLTDVIGRHKMYYHFYTDDGQLYMMFKPLINAPGPKSTIEACVRNINCWMNANKHKLNNSKTELFVIQAPQRPLSSLQSISSGTKLIQSTRSAKNIGVWFDDIMAMHEQTDECYL